MGKSAGFLGTESYGSGCAKKYLKKGRFLKGGLNHTKRRRNLEGTLMFEKRGGVGSLRNGKERGLGGTIVILTVIHGGGQKGKSKGGKS